MDQWEKSNLSNMKEHSLSGSPRSSIDLGRISHKLPGDSEFAYGQQSNPLLHAQHSNNDVNGNRIGSPSGIDKISAFGTQSEPPSFDQYVLSIDLSTMSFVICFGGIVTH